MAGRTTGGRSAAGGAGTIRPGRGAPSGVRSAGGTWPAGLFGGLVEERGVAGDTAPGGGESIRGSAVGAGVRRLSPGGGKGRVTGSMAAGGGEMRWGGAATGGGRDGRIPGGGADPDGACG